MAAARANLGLGTAATHPASDFLPASEQSVHVGTTAPADSATTPLWVDTSQVPPVLKGWDHAAWSPVGGFGANRSQQYSLPTAVSYGTTPSEVRISDVPAFGASIRIEVDGDVPGPCEVVIYRAGTYNRCQGGPVVALSEGSWWHVTGLADDHAVGFGWDRFTVFVDGNGPDADLVVRNYCGFPRHLRVYWSEI